jgi:transketolase
MTELILHQGSEATRFGFGRGVRKAAVISDKIIGLGSDITASVSMNLFRDAYPSRFYSLGIAEQNAVSVAAGLSLSGLIPVFSTYGVFSTMRALDQIRISLCYNNVHALIGGAHAGISVGPDGATHQALEDMAVMRVLPHMTVLSPADSVQAELLSFQALLEGKGPIYIRYGREPRPLFTSLKQKIEIGKAQIFRKGGDISLIATGHMLWEAIEASKLLEQEGIEADIINLHTIKPIDRETIIQSARKTGKVLTTEEHQIMGGMGSAVAEVLAQEYPVPMIMHGMQNQFGESGQPNELMEKYQLTAKGIYHKAKKLLGC